MDTRIRLVTSKPQLAFLGEITDNRLLQMTKMKNTLAIMAIKWVLGEDFITGVDRYKVNTDIVSQFVASLLDLRECKAHIIQLTKELFPKHYLGGLEEIIHTAVIGLSIPIAIDL